MSDSMSDQCMIIAGLIGWMAAPVVVWAEDAVSALWDLWRLRRG